MLRYFVQVKVWMPKRNLFKIILFLEVLAFLFPVPVYPQHADLSESYSLIDAAFSEKSEEKLTEQLFRNKDSPGYVLCENYIMKKIRQLVIAGDFEFARTACLVVIDNNMDNTDAIAMYSVIDDGIARRKAEEEAQERKKEAEEVRIALERKKLLEQVQSKYQAVPTSSGKSVYVRENESRYSSLSWQADFGMADISMINVSSENYTSARYGITSEASLVYQTDQIAVGAEGTVEFLMATLSNSDDTILSSYTIVPKIAFSSLSDRLFFRMGAASYVTTAGSEKNKVLDTFITPLAGIDIENITFGGLQFKASYDYYFGHFAYDDLKSAMAAGILVRIPVADLEKIRIGFDVGVRDTLFIRDGGTENRVRTVLAFGVGNVTE